MAISIQDLETTYKLALDQVRANNDVPTDWAWRRARRREAGVVMEYALPGGGYIQLRWWRCSDQQIPTPKSFAGYVFSTMAPTRWWV